MSGFKAERKTSETVDKAVALLYERDHGDAPRVVASGKGELAARIVATAREAGVVITQDPELSLIHI